MSLPWRIEGETILIQYNFETNAGSGVDADQLRVIVTSYHQGSTFRSVFGSDAEITKTATGVYEFEVVTGTGFWNTGSLEEEMYTYEWQADGTVGGKNATDRDYGQFKLLRQAT
jgi:hypothetical protein